MTKYQAAAAPSSPSAQLWRIVTHHGKTVPALIGVDTATWGEMPRAGRRRQLQQAMRRSPEELEAVCREACQSAVLAHAVQAIQGQLEAEADEACGVGRYGRGEGRRAYRYGYTLSSLVLDGRRVPVVRPRVRTCGDEQDPPREVVLKGWAELQAAQGQELRLQTEVLQHVLNGGTVRSAGVTLQQGCPLPVLGSSASSASRWWVTATAQVLEEFLNRRLDGERYVALFVDGLQENLGAQQDTLLVAVGVTERGEKHVLGMHEASTENAAACQQFLEGLVERGLDVGGAVLVVLDGSKGLAAGVRAVFGARAVIQRCVVHKMRNVLEKLPKGEQGRVARQLVRAWDEDDAARAEGQLKALADRLEAAGRGEAAASLREGLEETLTVQRLGLPRVLRRSLRSTNQIESLIARERDFTHHVTRWRDAKMVMRWAAVGLARGQETSKAHRRLLRGHAALPCLRAALLRHVGAAGAANAASA